MILCGRSPRHLYVANQLCQRADVQAIVHELPAQWTAEKLWRNSKPSVFLRKTGRWIRDRRRYAGNPEAKYFFRDQQPRLERQDLVREVPSVSDPQTLALASELKPDLICVFGTSLIRGPLLERFRLINLHGGLSPDYRGADCTFWALYNGEPQNVGCTLHFIDTGIDTGGLIAHVCPELRQGDDELTLFWRSVEDSADVFAEAVERFVSGNLTGKKQTAKGRLYQVKDRTLACDMELSRKMRRIEMPQLGRRVAWF